MQKQTKEFVLKKGSCVAFKNEAAELNPEKNSPQYIGQAHLSDEVIEAAKNGEYVQIAVWRKPKLANPKEFFLSIAISPPWKTERKLLGDENGDKKTEAKEEESGEIPF